MQADLVQVHSDTTFPTELSFSKLSWLVDWLTFELQCKQGSDV